ncbi:hypothetical protein HYZ64_03585 [Candidatus Berkelbacteria bacterium]|nr:hypothetical protein [Candidatus Berkelbacteria bacterium]
MARDLEQQIEELTKAVKQSNRQSTLWYSFWHGIVVGIGSTVGVAVILAAGAFLVRNLLNLGILSPIQKLLPSFETSLEQSASEKTSKLPAVVPDP